MSSELVTRRRTGFDITPAHAAEPTLVHRFGDHAEAPTLWLSEGLSNAWQLVTPDGRMIINTGMGFEGPVHRSCFDQVADGPVRYIVFSQGHVDHVGGTDRFVEEGTEIVAQSAQPRCAADDARIHRFRVHRSAVFWADAVARADAFLRSSPGPASAVGDTAPPTQSIPTPTLTFDDHLDLEFGGVRIELLSVPGGETVDSLVVWFPEARLAIVGNTFGALFGHIPNFTTIRGDRPRDPLAFIAACDRVLALDAEVLCTGHFEPITGARLVRSEITRIRDGVQWLHDTVIRGMNRGRSVEELMGEVRLPDELSLGEGYGTTRWAVRAIWEGYAGWFHFRSTTELHAVPASNVHTDLVELAGADPIVASARSHLVAGRPLEAIHLLEMVRHAQPAHREAIVADIDAHNALLQSDVGENFWESGWLRLHITRSQAELDQLDA